MDDSKKIDTNGFGFVDLDLPSGTLWATQNVGASKPYDFGLYFQWGDAKGYTKDQIGTGSGQKKFEYDYSDYKWYLSGSTEDDNIAFKKYKTTGATLDLEDDAARNHMGGDWHMPSPAQIQELLVNTTNTWIAQDAVNGRLFTSKKDSSKSIFIPAVNEAWDGFVRGSGYYGGVLSSMLSKEYVDGVQVLDFGSGGVGLIHDERYRGYSVRGVIG